ncbi:MAG: 50S ribosomal protein L19 [Flavobacteriales bacterium]|nr:50S ribosomal protein L19 [Flavobacteriales bacterium]MBK6945871.1 50S ribosomal protein L19 [Flavobacteriales bacterium]MBK7298540.1 50S ribosomal protein L19 [Flavobacteriales bacterium]MBK9536698.1 50S ribosomal protein L19 [Flavobacteriales bacterium]MBP9139186.1 50S ribosomal protein L19 [Flavobacteriales bacterium]
MDRIKQLEKEYAPLQELAAFKAGDTVTVHYKIVEGTKERIQQYQGVVLQRKGSGSTATFTVRKISNNIGVERIFPIASPFIDKVEVNKRGDVNRARIFYLRELRGKSARISEKRQSAGKDENNKEQKIKVARSEKPKAAKKEVAK